MIIMINGAFGAGKTTVANLLLEKIPSSMLVDPEIVGFMLRAIITDEIKNPEEKTDNFQDLGMWKILVVQVAELLIGRYSKNLIVPMTIYNKEYFQYIFNGFKRLDEDTYHFCLVGSEETITKRLLQRGEVKENWCFEQLKKCLVAYEDKLFEEFIVTDELSPEDIVKLIVRKTSA